jgi:hypothetical protein
MTDVFLKAGSEEDLAAALPWARGDDSWRTVGTGWALDVIGTMYNDDAVFGETGEMLSPPTAREGFHANLRCSPVMTESIPQAVVIPPPATPRRRWL